MVGAAQVCYPNPSRGFVAIVRCTVPLPGNACGSPEEHLFSGRCCALLQQTSGPDPVCAQTPHFSDVGAGIAADSDGDFIPDLVDNCPLVSNFTQVDSNHDGIGDACSPTAVPAVPFCAMPMLGGFLALVGVVYIRRRGKRLT
jgi:hypothetical protein